MSRGFEAGNRGQLMILPPSIDDWISEGHLVRFLWEAVSQIDLSDFYLSYADEGRPPYDPAVMLSVLLYSYCNGKRSSRKIAKACEEAVPYRWLTGNLTPDHCSIARFRQRHERLLQGVFVEVLRLCAEADLVKVGRVFLDGTKLGANASLSSNRGLEKLSEEIDKILEEAKKADLEEDRQFGKDRSGEELPEGLRDRGSRLERLKEAKARLELAAERERAAQHKKIRTRQEQEEAVGKKKRGRKPKAPDEAVNTERKANPTDPDSRIMKNAKGYVQGYNGQAVVTEEQIIVACEVTQQENDLHQLEPMLEATKETLEDARINESPEMLGADAGYFRDDLDVVGIEQNGPELLLAIQKDWKQRKAQKEQPAPKGRIPKDATTRYRMDRKLRTKRGRSLYKLRSQTVEPVFGHIKTILGFVDFMRRGLKAVQSEWNLICACYNLLKLFRAKGMTTALR